MMAPERTSRVGVDTYFVEDPAQERKGQVIDVRDPRTRSFGHIEPSNMDVSRQTQDQLAVSASMRTALLVYSGITVKMMLDSELGAQHSTIDRKSTRLNSSHRCISYAVFCLKKKR